jgi:hypothetical protein
MFGENLMKNLMKRLRYALQRLRRMPTLGPVWALLVVAALAPAPAVATNPVMVLLPGYFGLGLQNSQSNISWMRNSRVPWNYRYQYLNPRWESWNSPSGSFVLNYAKQGYIPIFTWYVIGGSSWGNPYSALFTSSGLQSASNMNGVFTSFVLALKNAATSGVSPIIFHIEPDLWGFMEQYYGDDATRVPVSVGSSAYAAVANFANNAAGFAQALVSLRNTYAPGVILAWHASDWGPDNGFDPTLTTYPSYNTPQVTGQRVATFYKSFGASFDMIFHDPSDADSAYKVLVRKQSSRTAWWTNTAFSNYLSYVGAVYSGTGLQSMLWQVPSGNTLYQRVNNKTNHYQDNRPQYFLQAGNRYQNISNFVGQGVIGLLFGFGHGTTDYMDDANDGITNPPAICGNPFCSSTDTTTWNTTTATVADDDGGFLRSAATAYYAAGPIATSSTTTASLAAGPTSITSGQSSTLSWTSTNASSCTGTNFTPTGVSGSVTVSPTKSTTYRISCTGTGGSASASASVPVKRH